MSWNKCLTLVLLVFAGFCSSGQELKLGLPTGHAGSVKTAKYSPDGKYIVTASDDRTACIWDAQSGKLIYTLEVPIGDVIGAQFSPESMYIVTASDNGLSRIWEVSSAKLLALYGGERTAMCSPDGKHIITASWMNTAVIWQSPSGKLVHELVGHTDDVNSAEYSPDGKYVVTASKDSTARIWDVQSGKLVHLLEGHSNTVISAKFSPDGKYVVTASGDKTARIWDVKYGELVHSLKGHIYVLTSAQYSPDNKYIVTASGDGTARIWDAQSGKLVHSLEGHSGWVTSAQYSSDGKHILTASGDDQSSFENNPLPAWDNTARIWDAKSGKLVHTLEGKLSSVSYSPDGKHLVTASLDKSASIWDAQTGKLVHSLEGHTAWVTSAQYSPDGKHIVTAYGDHTASVLEVKSGKIVYLLEGHIGQLHSAQYSPDGKHIATASSDKTARIWDTQSGKLVHSFEGHTSWVTSAQYNPDGKYIVTASDDNTARIWDAKSGMLIHSLEGHNYNVNNAKFSPDGMYVVTTSDHGTVRVWEAQSGKPIHLIQGYNSSMNNAHFSMDGKHFVTSARDNTALIWNTQSGEIIQSLEGHTRLVTSAQYSLDGKHIVTTSGDKTVRIWDASSGMLIHTLAGYTSYVRQVQFSPNGKYLFTKSIDGTAGIWDVQSGKLVHLRKGHSNVVNSAYFSPDSKHLVEGSKDGSILIWNVADGKQAIRHFIFDGNSSKWVHIHSSGLFDASPEAMKLMYWTKGLEVIEFEQLKDRYWLPGLWEKVMKGEELPDITNIGELKLQPEVVLAEVTDGILPITLKKRDGGYGKVSIFVNGKEVAQDARGNQIDTSLAEQTIYYSIADHPSLINGENEITVSASSADGFVKGRGVKVKTIVKKKEVSLPSFYGVVIGISDYANDQIDLVYPEKDAEAIAQSIQKGAENLFNVDRAHTYTISSSSYTLPTKANIKIVFEEIASKAKAEDVIFVYLAGHGITWGNGSESDFYFLTSDATAANKEAYSDPQIRATRTISTSEMVEWLKDIAALKQVMIIDACGSGQAVENLIASRDVDASQIKAIDRMKDRTGMYVLSGCAADAVSYEASQYGQGLLTYSILEALSGAALKNGQNVDVFTIMDYARERVPELATDIGGIQTPQLLIPSSGSFDIGILDEADKTTIPLASVKTVYIRSTLVNKKKYRDTDGLSKMLNRALDESTMANKVEYIYLDADEFKNSCQITGGYSITDAGYSLDLTIICRTTEESHLLTAATKEELVEKIVTLAAH